MIKAIYNINYMVKTLMILFLIGLFGGCGDLDSSWRHNKIIIDGNDTEWKGMKTYGEKGKFGFSFSNDKDYLYLRLFTWDQQLQLKVMKLGFTVWFDPEGKENKSFGIRFPIKRQKGGMSQIKNIFKVFNESPKEVEILDLKHERIKLSKLSGIEVDINFLRGRIIYELKVPLQVKKEQYGIGTDLGKTIGIGFETMKPDKEMVAKMKSQRQKKGNSRMGSGKGGGMGSSGSMGRGGGMKGGRGGSMGGHGGKGGDQERQQFKLWTKVTLAAKPLHETVK